MGRGTRQDFPLSPFLFALMMEPLAVALRLSWEVKAVRVGTIDKGLVLYANDLLLYLKDLRESLTADWLIMN